MPNTRQAIFEYIEVIYNRHWLKKRLGYQSPINFLDATRPSNARTRWIQYELQAPELQGIIIKIFFHRRTKELTSIFFQSLLIAYSGAVMPGPLLTYNINQSIRIGIRSGVLLITGHALLELSTIALLFLGMGAILSTFTAQSVIGLAGGALLITFGALMIKDVLKGNAKLDMQVKEKKKPGGLILNGFVISAMNPYFITWWTVVGLGLMMAAFKTYGFAGIVVFFLGHILADFSWYILISLLVSRTKKVINVKVYRTVVFVLALVLIGFGINFIVYAAIKLFR